MKCAIAKHNPLILLQAVKHYQKSAQIFTFPSLYDDFEPYPIKEVVGCIKAQGKRFRVRYRRPPVE